MKKKANEAHMTFKSKLNKEFVEKNDNNPKSTYSIVDMTHWDEFVAIPGEFIISCMNKLVF